MPFMQSPLFQEATRQVQAAASRQFRSSQFGRLLTEVQQAVRPNNAGQQVQNTLRRFSAAAKPSNVIRQMMGAEFGQVVQAVERYSRGGGTAQQRLVDEFLNQLGPAGNLIKSLVNPSRKAGLTAELNTAMNLIRAFGGEVLPGKGKEWATMADVERGLAAAIKTLEKYGFTVSGSQGPPRRAPAETLNHRKTVDVEMGYRKGTSRVRPDHPMVTGEMVKATGSTNVYEFGYDLPNGILYVRFQTAHEKGSKGSAGSLYQYTGVTPEEFMGLYRVKDMGNGSGPGAWVWDVLRVRGSLHGHHKDYKLVGIMNNYVPRKATVRTVYETKGKRGQPLKRPRKIGEEVWYEQRTVKTHEGRWARSVKQTTRVSRPLRPKN